MDLAANRQALTTATTWQVNGLIVSSIEFLSELVLPGKRCKKGMGRKEITFVIQRTTVQ